MSPWDSPLRRARFMAAFAGLLAMAYWAMTREAMVVPGILGIVVAAVAGYLRMRGDPAVTGLRKAGRKPCSSVPVSTRRSRH